MKITITILSVLLAVGSLAQNPTRMIDEVRTRYNISEDTFGNMLVAITEAVTNAIYHGNKADPKKKVNVTYLLTTHYQLKKATLRQLFII